MANKKARNRATRAGGKKARAARKETNSNKLAFPGVEAEAARIVKAVVSHTGAAGPKWWQKETAADDKGPAKASVTSHKVDAASVFCANHKPTKVFLINDGKNHVYAGAGSNIGHAVETGKLAPALVIDLASMHVDFSPEWPVETNGEAKSVLPEGLWAKPAFKNPAVLRIDWPDGAVPETVNEDWWRLMADTILRMPGDVTINCVGGHGRTGTFLAIIGHMMGAIPDKECPVEWVREHYCFDAIETEPQIRYIEDVLHVTVHVTANGWYSSGTKTSQWPAHLSTVDDMDEWKQTERENGYGPNASDTTYDLSPAVQACYDEAAEREETPQPAPADAYTAGVMRAIKAAKGKNAVAASEYLDADGDEADLFVQPDEVAKRNAVAHAAGVGPYEDDARIAALTTEEAIAADFDEDGRLLRGI